MKTFHACIALLLLALGVAGGCADKGSFANNYDKFMASDRQHRELKTETVRFFDAEKDRFGALKSDIANARINDVEERPEFMATLKRWFISEREHWPTASSKESGGASEGGSTSQRHLTTSGRASF